MASHLFFNRGAALKTVSRPARSILLRHFRGVLPGRLGERTDLLIEDGIISRVIESHGEDSQAIRAGGAVGISSTIDLDDLTLYPGFIDVHIHGAVGVDTMEASTEDLGRVSQFLAAQGVTGWLPTLVPAPTEDYERAIAAVSSAMRSQAEEPPGSLHSQPGSRILGVHYEGPFVNSSQCGALRSNYFRTYSGVNDLADLPLPASTATSTATSTNAAKMITLAPEIDGGVELVRELKRRGWIVSIGHTRAGVELLDKAFEAGAQHMTHFMNAMAPLHHRSPGPVAWGLMRDRVTCDMIADGIHLDPHVLQLLFKLKGSEGLMLISDAVAAAGQGDGDYQIWGETITVKARRTSNAAGSIAGSVITMLDAVRLMRSLGVPEVDLARMASTNPARLLGLDWECGTIEEGKRADLVALNAQGEVVLTLVSGEIVFDGRGKSEQ
jgi:N-acetylglucosamine-6-phosphate deacetylase